MTITDADARAIPRDDAVTILAWPAEADRVAAAERVGQPRLLLVAADAAPPETDAASDWVRLPVTPRDLEARLSGLRRHHAGAAPRVDDHDVLWRGNRWVALSPAEADIVRALLDLGPGVVSRDAIACKVWPDGVPTGRPIDARLPRLRGRLAEVGLRVHTVRRRGFLLESTAIPGALDER
jgi:hypothetical protein